MSQHTAAVIGCTGLVGSRILSCLAGNVEFSGVSAIARRPLPTSTSTSTSASASPPSDKVTTVVEADSGKWAVAYGTLQQTPGVFFSALGTTRAQAGGLDKQRAIDYDLNLEMARAAAAAGTRVYVLISSSGASSGSMFPYTKMKGQLEDEVAKLGFEHTVILRPGLLVGPREDSRPSEYLVRMVATGVGRVSKGLTDFWAQTAEEVGAAAVQAGRLCLDGKQDKGVWMVYQKDIVELARSG